MARRVLVIGAGVIGLCCALYLRRRGFEVAVVDAGGPGRDGVSYGNAGLIVPSHFVPLAAPGVVRQALRWMLNPESPFYLRPRPSFDLLDWGYRFWRASTPSRSRRAEPLILALNRASAQLYDELAGELRDGFGLGRRGLLSLCATAAGLEHEATLAARARELGMAVSVLSPAEVSALEPRTEFDIAGAVHFPEDRHLDPGKLMAALERELARAGVEFLWQRQVVGLAINGELIGGVGTDRGVERADEVVLAAGSWSGKIARAVGLRLPLEPGRGYNVTVEQTGEALETPLTLAEARVAVTPLGGGRIRFGGTMELSGFRHAASARRVKGIIDSSLRYLPALDRAKLETAPRWHGLRPCSPDGLPYLGRSRRYANLTIATGHAMMGLSLAPVTGKLVSELVAHEAPSLAIGTLDPERFA